MVLSGNSTQANCSRTNSVVALSGKEQISPILLLSDNAPDNHTPMEPSHMASVIRTSLRNRKKPSLSVSDQKELPGDDSYMSLVDFLSKTSPDALPLGKNGISSLWTCGQCCQTFLSNAELQVHLNSHKTKYMPPHDNPVKSVIANTKKRQSPEEPPASKRLKRSSSPNPPWFVFNSGSMQQIASNGEKFYKCDICEQLFATSDGTGFKIHYLRSHINYQFISSSDRVLCSIVDDGLKSKVTDHLYRCYFCNISCTDKNILIEHNAEHKRNVFRCEYCHSVFYQNKAFTNHTKNCTKAPLTMCLFCKEPIMFDDSDVHTRKYHCYSNAVLRVECAWGCALKVRKLCDLFKHCVTVHRNEYFACVMCKIRFHTPELLHTHNKTKHNIDTPKTKDTLSSDSKPNLGLINKIKSKPVKPTSSGDGSLSKPSTQSTVKLTGQPTCKPNGSSASLKPNGQPTGKSNGSSVSLKPTGQHTALKPNSQSSLPTPSSSTLSSQQRHFQDILFKSILKIDLIEQVNVLKKHAAQYPSMLRLPQHPVFASTSQDTSCPHCPNPGEEDFIHPVFSSSHDNNVYICKACGLQTVSQDDMTAHMTSIHPLIHNDCFVFNKEDLPEGLWSLSQPPDVKSTGRNSFKSRGVFKCTCCAFECRDSAEFHKHLLQCAKKQKYKTEVQSKAKQEAGTGEGGGKKEESPRRRMVITGVFRQVPDDPLFSYKKELEKTIRKPGDSETVFNMLNKLPSKRLVKTTERYDALYYKNNKAMKPKRSSLERLTQVLNDKDLCYSLSDYLKYFVNQDSQDNNQREKFSNTSHSQSDKPSGELNKVQTDRKPKVAKTSVISEELYKSTGDKKIKGTKFSQTQLKETKAGEKRVKSPKLEDNKQNGDGKKCKVPKMNNVDEKKVKTVKLNGSPDNIGRKVNGSSGKMNGQLYSLANKVITKETLPKVKNETEAVELEIATPRSKHDDITVKSLQNIKVVQLHYPTNLNTKSQHSPPLANNTKCKAKTVLVGNKTKNILVEKKGKHWNLNNAAAGVKKKGKLGLDVKKKLVVVKKKDNGASKKLNHLVKVDTNCDKPNVVATLRESPPRKKKTTRIVVVSDEPLVPLLTMKKDKKK
uniref:C2H2-type domain-containing protein n=2 Tax=Cacopsylla melanoneura TaxID=428564 RepID=A0A8D9A330_9HEMI